MKVTEERGVSNGGTSHRRCFFGGAEVRGRETTPVPPKKSNRHFLRESLVVSEKSSNFVLTEVTSGSLTAGKPAAKSMYIENRKRIINNQ